MKENEERVKLSAAEKPTLYEQIKETLALASQLIIAAPVKLPSKVLTVAKCVALAIGVLDAVDGASKEWRKDDEIE